MIELYVNGMPREDIDIMQGSQLSQTAAHVTSSSVSVSVPIETDDLNEYDHVQISDGGHAIFAGTILSLAQRTTENIGLSYRVYDLTLASYADNVAMIYTDLVFTAGASVTQILMGNHPGAEWYQGNLGEFCGLLEMRIIPEDIQIGRVDRFDHVKLEAPARLWGQPVKDVLDKIAEITDAWWDITPDRVFRFCSGDYRPAAPQRLDDEAAVYNLSVSRDAYTMYSAVRVVGGEGKSGREVYSMAANDTPRFKRESDTVLYSVYPVHSDIVIAQNPGIGALPAGCPRSVKVGFKGLHDNDSAYQALTSYGGHDITLKSGYTWLSINPSKQQSIRVTGYYLIPVYCRMVDPWLTDEIKSKRRGSGVVEFVIQDDSIVDFADASATAEAFLRQNGRVAQTIRFQSLSPGWEAGQMLTGDLTYYRIYGSYQITSVTATAIRDDGVVTWEYDIEASTAAYRDTYSTLFRSRQPITFRLDGDFPAADGAYINDNISIQTHLIAYAGTPVSWLDIMGLELSWEAFEARYPTWDALSQPSTPTTWAEFEAMDLTWAKFEAKFTMWANLENIKKGWYNLGNYLTAVGRKQLLSFIQGQCPAGGFNLCTSAQIVTASGVTTFAPEAISPTTNNSVTVTYYLLPDQLQEMLTALQINYGDSDTPILNVPLNIDRTQNNPLGEFSLTISMRHTIT